MCDQERLLSRFLLKTIIEQLSDANINTLAEVLEKENILQHSKSEDSPVEEWILTTRLNFSILELTY